MAARAAYSRLARRPEPARARRDGAADAAQGGLNRDSALLAVADQGRDDSSARPGDHARHAIHEAMKAGRGSPALAVGCLSWASRFVLVWVQPATSPADGLEHAAPFTALVWRFGTLPSCSRPWRWPFAPGPAVPTLCTVRSPGR